MRDICFVDLETTGLDPERHEIIELAAIRVSADLRQHQAALELKVRPSHIETADPEALSLNGYRQDAWLNAVELRDAMAELAPLLDEAVLAGYGVDFDEDFLLAAFQQTGVARSRRGYRRIDILSIAWPFAVNGVVPDLSLKTLTRAFGIRHDATHAAWSDCLACVELARRLVAYSSGQLPPHERSGR